MGQYDRFALQGGLDTATPYLAREPGTLLNANNFHPDTDGGYRMGGGYERFDGQVAPSEVIIYNLYCDTDVSSLLAGDGFVLDSPSGAILFVGRSYGTNVWVDLRSGPLPQAGDTFTLGGDTVTITAVTTEAVDFRSYVPGSQRTYIVQALALAGKSLAPGMSLLGLTSGATMTVASLLEFAAGYWVYLTADSTPPQSGETLQATDTSQYTVLAPVYQVEPMLSDPTTPAGQFFWLSQRRREVIGQVPGSGPVRGVWELNGKVYAVRDNMIGSAGLMYSSSSSGWQAVATGFTLTWDNRPTTVTDDFLGPGDIIQGVTSGATATVGWVGYSAQDHSSGYVTMASITGTFTVGEDIKNNSQPGTPVIGKVAAAAVSNALPPGGKYRFTNHNFFGGTDQFSMYGVNGVGQGFVYNEVQGFSFIPTGRPVELEMPFDLCEYKDHLFFAYPFGSLQHSVIGSPMDWSGGLGALEVGVGSEISSLIPGPKALIICTEKDIQSLEGGGVDDWQKEVITQHTGIAKFTGLYQSQSFVLAQAGIVAVDRTDAFGNFMDSTLSDRIRGIIVPAFPRCTGALARKDKGQYRVFYDGDTNICLSTNQGNVIGFSQFDYGGKTVRTACNPYGRVFFTSDDGFVYHDDVGGSNDGEERVSVMRTSFANQGDPDTRKRYRRIDMTLNSESFVNFRVLFSFDKDSSVPQSSIDSGMLVSGGGRWDLSNWNEVYWDASDSPTVSSDIDGIGFDISVLVYVQSRIHPPFIVEDVSLEWSPRRKVR